MKQLSLLFIVAFLVFSSCKKEDSNPISPENQIPNPPKLVYPANSAENIVTPTNFSWEASSTTIFYMLQVSEKNDFTTLVYDNNVGNVTSKQISLENGKKYYWRVAAANSVGQSEYSGAWSFNTGAIPGIPKLISPKNDSTIGENTAIIVEWEQSSGATNYYLMVSKDKEFTDLVVNDSIINTTTIQINGLSSGKYYWRVRAKNLHGYSNWSNTASFYILSCGVSKINYYGKLYNTVLIGNQCWLKENLDVGTMIQGNQNQTNNSVIEKYCYDNNPANCNTYGGLYQWNEAMQYSTTPGTKGICPEGWHIPTYAELQTLASAVGNNSNALKAVGQGSGGGAGTNTSGFSALLSGDRDDNGYFNYLGYGAYFWGSTESSATYAYGLGVGYSGSNINFGNGNKEYGFSVRCVKD